MSPTPQASYAVHEAAEIQKQRKEYEARELARVKRERQERIMRASGK